MYNFGKIKETYNKVYMDSFTDNNEDKRKIFGYYLNLITKNPLLNEEFEAYFNIQNKTFGDELSSQIFIQDNIDAVKKINYLDLEKIHENLETYLKSNGYELIENTDEKVQLFESLLSLDKKSKNIGKISESLLKLRKSMISESNEDIQINEFVNLPSDIMTNMMVNKFNNKYGELDSDTKEMIKISLDGSINDKIGMYTTTIKECLDSLNIKLKESEKDLDLREKLLQTKEKLLEMSFNEETYIDDLSKVIELKSNL